MIDVGAHIGSCAFAFALKGHKVYAFEANKKLADLIAENVVLNRMTNLEVINAAINETGGFVRFDADGPYGHVVDSGGEKNVVPAVSLDSWSRDRNLPAVGLIKMDIEGSELRALQGGREFLARTGYPPIYIEINGHCLNWFGATPNDLFRLASSLGYVLNRYEPNGIRPVSPEDLEPSANWDYLFLQPRQETEFGGNILPPFTRDELTGMILRETTHECADHRAYVGRILQHFPEHALRPEIAERLHMMSGDPHVSVRQAVAWLVL